MGSLSRAEGRAAWGSFEKELDPICHLEETVSWVGDSSSCGRTQPTSPPALGEERAWIDLSFNPTPALAGSVCSVPSSSPSPLENHGRLC